MRTTLHTALVAVALSGGLTGCNLIFGIEGGELTGGTGGSSTTTNQGGAGTGGEGGSTTTNSGGSSVGGGGTGGGSVASCEPEKLEVGETIDASCGVFVNHSGTGDGKKVTPIGDIQAGANAAVAQGKTNLYICGADSFALTSQTLNLPASLNVYGALACSDWHYDATAIPTIGGHDNSPVVILDGSGSVQWADFNVRATDATALGASSIAVIINGAQLLAKRVTVFAGKGGVGEAGAPFGAPQDQSPAGQIGDGCGASLGHGGPPGMLNCMTASGGMQSVSGGSGGAGAQSAGASGSAGGNGAANVAPAGAGGHGTFAAAGCAPGTVGSTGGIGGAAPMAAGDGSIGSTGFMPAGGRDGVLGMHGGGGGGGGGGAKASSCFVNNGGGGGGAGGCGGAGGHGGHGGGASFGYVVLSGAVSLVGGGVTTQRGGTGGVGNLGQVGGLGGNGGGPQSGTGGVSCAGGAGGTGGPGGPGSGGPGGPASCFATDAGTITLDSTTPTTLDCGTPSAGGLGASQGGLTAPTGASGNACTHLDYAPTIPVCTP